MRKMSDKGLAALVHSEGIVTSRYKDSVGVWTLGVGHTAAAGPPDPASFFAEMTVERCLELFREDVAKYEKAVDAAITVPLTQNEFDALVHWHYNTGSIKTATLTKTINAGNKELGGQQIMNWNKPKEIIGRREMERDMFLKGKYPGTMANVYPAVGGQVQWGKAKQVDVLKLLTPPKSVPVAPAPSEQEPVSFWSELVRVFSNLFKKKA